MSGSRIRQYSTPEQSRSLERGTAILECFNTDHTTLRVSDIADQLGMARSSAHRYITTLAELGYLEQNTQHRYRLASRALNPGLAVLTAIQNRMNAQPVLEQLRNETGHTAALAVRDTNQAIYVQRASGHRQGQFQADQGREVGVPLPLHCTAIGKALIALLPDDQRRELLTTLDLDRHGPNTLTSKRRLEDNLEGATYQVDDEESAAGVRAIAAPVTKDSEIIAAIDITVPAHTFTIWELAEQLAPTLMQAADTIATSAGPTPTRKSAARRRMSLTGGIL